MAGGPGVLEQTTNPSIGISANGQPPTRLPEPNKQTRSQDQTGLQARAIWVRRALQRAEPGAPQKPGL